jgi:hypothetical protein
MTRLPNNADKNKPKTVDSKTYWWCPHHMAWGNIRLQSDDLIIAQTIMVIITLVTTVITTQVAIEIKMLTMVQKPTSATTAIQ